MNRVAVISEDQDIVFNFIRSVFTVSFVWRQQGLQWSESDPKPLQMSPNVLGSLYPPEDDHGHLLSPSSLVYLGLHHSLGFISNMFLETLGVVGSFQFFDFFFPVFLIWRSSDLFIQLF